MLAPVILCVAGFGAGCLLLRRIPHIPDSAAHGRLRSVSVIIPARNEELTLPLLLTSLLEAGLAPAEVIVVDDHSCDATARIAASFEARVVPAPPLEPGWIGKSWACFHGALAAKSELFFFVDADATFMPGSIERILNYYSGLPEDAALSILPYHDTKHWFEQLSLFFNVIAAMAAGGFTHIAPPKLFGQSLLISRELYFQAGGHAAVRGEILENFKLANKITDVGGHCCTIGGRSTLHMHMFPGGFRQMNASWRKGFAAGAGASGAWVLTLISVWLGAVILAFGSLFALSGVVWAALMYLSLALQLAFLARQVGNFSVLASLLYPIGLAYYLIIFTQSAWMRFTGRRVIWKDREL